jgi:hypothetical protein
MVSAWYEFDERRSAYLRPFRWPLTGLQSQQVAMTGQRSPLLVQRVGMRNHQVGIKSGWSWGGVSAAVYELL